MTKQSTKAKATQAHMRATAKWEAANYDKVLIRFPRGTKDRITATGATVNGFTVSAVTDRLDGKAQPDTPPATVTAPDTAPANVLQVPLSPNMVSNMDGAIRCGYSSDRVQYAIRAINKQIQDDIAAEKEKRRARSVYPSFTIQHGHPGDAGYDPDDPGEYPDIYNDY